eukprot:2423731-Ditylum_brightwellii.AAC.1
MLSQPGMHVQDPYVCQITIGPDENQNQPSHPKCLHLQDTTMVRTGYANPNHSCQRNWLTGLLCSGGAQQTGLGQFSEREMFKILGGSTNSSFQAVLSKLQNTHDSSLRKSSGTFTLE